MAEISSKTEQDFEDAGCAKFLSAELDNTTREVHRLTALVKQLQADEVSGTMDVRLTIVLSPYIGHTTCFVP